MGTINYRTSDYITMGARIYDVADFEEDKGEIIDEMHDNGYSDISDDDFREYVNKLIMGYYDGDYCSAQSTLDLYDFHYFKLSLEIGYYEGFSLDIKYLYDGDKFTDMEEKREAYAELEEIEVCLCNLAYDGMRACYPFWYTEYEGYDGTIAKIHEAIKEMKEDVRMTDVHRFEWEV